MNNKLKVKLNDYARILVSETSPYDVPIIFSNNWFYRHIRSSMGKNTQIKQDIINFLFLPKSTDKYCIPMRYKIRKNDKSFRYMGLLHPTSQTHIIEFYKNYSLQILHYCSQSSYSIRQPAKIASSFYIKNRFDENRKYRNENMARLSDEKKFKHATSYYAYNRHTKLHQFFDDKEFHRLEGKYTDFWSIDISKCFDSIYTHSVTWATKGKLFSKTAKADDSFGAIFDLIMQRSNYNETNGIVIGNEVSRIFAEVILQSVDVKTKEMLERRDILEGVDYDIRRYVDDFFIFSTSTNIAQKVFNAIEENLRTYKLHINTNKTKKSQKPFITRISKAKLETAKALNELSTTLFTKNTKQELVANITPIRNTHAIIRSFINKIKAPCYNDKESYNAMSGYIIAALLNTVKQLSKSEDKKTEEEFTKYRDSFTVLLEISFHLFSVNPIFSNSIKLCMLCYISILFFEKHFRNEDKTIKLLINIFIKDFFDSGKCKQVLTNGENYFSIEFANLLFISRNMGRDYLLNQKQLSDFFDIKGLKARNKSFLQEEENTDYFQIISLLYYIGNEPEYNRIKQEVVKLINHRLANLQDITLDAKICFLFLDSVACPYLKKADREKWSKKFGRVLYRKNLSQEEEEKLFKTLASEQWFTSWHYPDLWNTLEKKELLFDY